MGKLGSCAVRLALAIGLCAPLAGCTSKEPPVGGALDPVAPAPPKDLTREKLRQLLDAFKQVELHMTKQEIERIVGEPLPLAINRYDLRLGPAEGSGAAAGVMIEDGLVVGSWGSGEEINRIAKVQLGMTEQQVRELLTGQKLDKCEVYRWGATKGNTPTFEISFFNGCVWRISKPTEEVLK